MKKITVIGGGNAGCFTALYCAWMDKQKDFEVELIYDPEIPPERVGQATILEASALLWATTGFNWYDNKIHATMKSGILYENWGNTDKLFHPFPADSMAIHYCPWEMQASILTSGKFKTTYKNLPELDDVDSDYIFDCSGKPDNYDNYEELINPINACILAEPNWRTAKNPWSRHVATPDGWCFVIPTRKKSPSFKYCVGYCYNSNITSQEEAEENFLNMFDVSVTKHVQFKNYVAKEPVIDNRIFLNGNRLFFLEPLESSSTQTYIEMARAVFDYYLQGKVSAVHVKEDITKYIKQLQNFVLWHYQSGSKFDTPFWEYAKTLTFKDETFDKFLGYSEISNCIPITYGGTTQNKLYGQWPAYSFKNWNEGMTLNT